MYEYITLCGGYVMKRTKIMMSVFSFAVVLFLYGSAEAQVVEAIKDAASKTKEVTVDAAKKTSAVVTDGVETAADKTKDVTVDTAKKAASASKKVGNYTVETTEGVVGKAYERGKYVTETTWDGTKWISKRVWYTSKKAATATKQVVVGEEEPKP